MSATFSVAPCSFRDARDLVVRYHYSQGSSVTCVESHGLFCGDELVGAAIWMPPLPGPAKYLAQKLGVSRTHVLCLSRFVLVPDLPTNTASFLLGRSMRRYRGTRWRALLTYADSRLGHTGVIYKATNWTYDGCTAKRRMWLDPRGKQVSPKATRNISAQELRERGCTQTEPFVKHRFYYEVPTSPRGGSPFPQGGLPH